MKTAKTQGERSEDSGFCDFGRMGHGMSAMMKGCCGGRDQFPGCMEEMKKQFSTPNQDAERYERRKK